FQYFADRIRGHVLRWLLPPDVKLKLIRSPLSLLRHALREQRLCRWWYEKRSTNHVVGAVFYCQGDIWTRYETFSVRLTVSAMKILRSLGCQNTRGHNQQANENPHGSGL